jgi:hypothetical protein
MEPTKNTEKNQVDKVSRGLSIAAIIVSVISAAAASFSAWNSWQTTQTAIAQVRPILLASFPDVISVGDELDIPLVITNAGKSRACIDSIRLVFWHDTSGGFKYLEWQDCQGMIFNTNQISRLAMKVDRYQDVNGSRIDISRGINSRRWLEIDIRYHGLEIESQFQESTIVPVSWKD